MLKTKVLAKYRMQEALGFGPGPHYHVTSKENAKSILHTGYFDKDSACTDEYISLIDDQAMEDLLKAKGLDLEEVDDETDEWIEHYGEGTIMFTSREPLMDYGDTVLEFTPPPAVELLQDDMHGTMWYYPITIPPNYFKVVK